MKVLWRKSAIESLLELDRWRSTVELPPIAIYLKDTIQTYFEQQELMLYIPHVWGACHSSDYVIFSRMNLSWINPSLELLGSDPPLLYMLKNYKKNAIRRPS